MPMSKAAGRGVGVLKILLGAFFVVDACTPWASEPGNWIVLAFGILLVLAGLDALITGRVLRGWGPLQDDEGRPLS